MTKYRTIGKANGAILLRLILLLIVAAGGISAAAMTQDKTVRLGVPTGFKERYPEADGIIWTDTLFKVIFERAGYTLEVRETPAKRAPHLVANGTVDGILSANQSLGIYRDKLLQAKYPGSSLGMYIYYRSTESWQPTWPPNEAFKQKSGVSKQSQESLERDWGLDIMQVTSFDSCIKMVNSGRADYWIDNITGITNATPGLVKYGSDDYAYRELFRIPIYTFFQPSERGRRLKAIYDRGIEEILRNGEFIEIYYRYDNRFNDSAEGARAVQQIRDMFPGLDVPEQRRAADSDD